MQYFFFIICHGSSSFCGLLSAGSILPPPLNSIPCLYLHIHLPLSFVQIIYHFHSSSTSIFHTLHKGISIFICYFANHSLHRSMQYVFAFFLPTGPAFCGYLSSQFSQIFQLILPFFGKI